MDVPALIAKYHLQPRGVIQAGSHHGEEHAMWMNMGLRYIAHFEPIQSNITKLNEVVSELQRKIPWHGVQEIFHAALGSSNKRATMFTETINGGQSCSLLQPKTHLSILPWIEFSGREEVEVWTLDGVPNASMANFLYVDAQGYELEVFRGARETLKHIDFIFTEVNRAEVFEGCGQIGELDAFLADQGFRRVETEWHGGEFGDALYVRA